MKFLDAIFSPRFVTERDWPSDPDDEKSISRPKRTRSSEQCPGHYRPYHCKFYPFNENKVSYGHFYYFGQIFLSLFLFILSFFPFSPKAQIIEFICDYLLIAKVNWLSKKVIVIIIEMKNRDMYESSSNDKQFIFYMTNIKISIYCLF